MKLPEGTPVLSMDSPTFAEDIAKAMGIGPGDKVRIVTPQFGRSDGLTLTPAPQTPMEWAALMNLTHEEIIAKGIGVWKKTAETIHYLFPKEWYDFIPNGMVVKAISGEEVPFEHGKTDDDTRFGLLAYGFLKHCN